MEEELTKSPKRSSKHKGGSGSERSSPNLSSKQNKQQRKLQSLTITEKRENSHSLGDFKESNSTDLEKFVKTSGFVANIESSELGNNRTRERSGTDARATYDPQQHQRISYDGNDKRHKHRSSSVEDTILDISQRKELQMEIDKANRRLQDLGQLQLSDRVEEKLLKTLHGSTENLTGSSSSSNNFQQLESPKDITSCMRDEQWGFVFWLYLRENYVHDHFSFVLAVEEFKLPTIIQQQQQTTQTSPPPPTPTPTDADKLKAQTILKKYFKPGSEYEMNIVEDLRTKLIDDVQNKLTFDVFDRLQGISWKVVNDYFPRFLTSDLLKGFLAGKKTRFVVKRRELRKTDTYRILRSLQKDHPDALEVQVSQEVEKDPLLNVKAAFGIKRGKCESCNCGGYDPLEANGVCNCQHWPAVHQELGRLPIKISTILEDKEKLVQKLIEPGLKLVSVLCDWTDIERKEVVAAAVVTVFEFYGRSLNLLKFALDKEIRTAEVTTLFREDRMSFRIASHYMRIVSIDWLRKTLGPVITALKGSSSYEINPHKLTNPPKEKPKNTKNLQKLAQSIFDTVMKQSSSIPAKLKMFCGLVYKKVKKMFPGHEVNALGVMLFLRFICPALCLPRESGIVDDKTQLHPNVARGLILVAKLLQNLSLNIRFNKETWMYELDDFIASNYPTMQKFLMDMASNEKVSTTSSSNTDSAITKQERENAKTTIYNEIRNTPNILDLAL